MPLLAVSNHQQFPLKIITEMEDDDVDVTSFASVVAALLMMLSSTIAEQELWHMV